MTPSVSIAPGESIETVLAAFREAVNQPETMRCADDWLLPYLDHLEQILTDPITEAEAKALLEVLYGRHIWTS